jgi:hypothetical protein
VPAVKLECDGFGREVSQDYAQRVAGSRYRLDKKLGEGRFGVVWAAHDRARDQPCCIKFLRPAYNAGFPLVRFKREFRAARRLRHDSCIRVHELGEREGSWYFTMELVAGSSLRQAHWLHRDCDGVVAVGLQILAALDHVHSHAIVHRDIKPLNILIERSAVGQSCIRAKLTDFGMAKVSDLDDDERLLVLRGSAPYLAPELVIDGLADARCDLYSLGVSLYQLLSGRHPLSSDTLMLSEWIECIKTREPLPLRDVAPAVPEPVARVVMRLLAKDPRARYRTAAQVYDELDQWLRGRVCRHRHPAIAPLTGSPYLAAPRLVGREPEMRAIEDFLAANLRRSAAARQAAPLLLVSGPAGAGKSRLLSWLVGRAAPYAPAVLVGQCRSEVGAPLEAIAGITDGLRDKARAGRAASAASAAGAMSSAAALTAPTDSLPFDPTRGRSFTEMTREGSDSGLAVSVASAPALPDRQDGAQDGPGRHYSGARAQLYELADLLGKATEGRPTLIVLEDIQWTDQVTLDLLLLWVRSVAVWRQDGRTMPVAIVATHRPCAADSAVGELRRALLAERRAVAVELAALPLEHSEQLVAELLMQPTDDEIRRVCSQLFAGRPATPLYITQVLQLLLARGFLTRDEPRWHGAWHLSELDDRVRLLIPATVDEAIGERAARLSLETKSLLSLAAVIGRRFELRVLAGASGQDEDLLRECLDEAARAGFIAEDTSAADGERYLFGHDRFREALYGALPEDQIRHLHATVAQALRGLSPCRGRDVASDLAHHYQCAGDAAESYRFAMIAGHQAFVRNQFSRASDLFAQAVVSADTVGRTPSTRVIERLGDAAALAVHTERAEQAYLRVLANPRSIAHQVRLYTKLGELKDRAHSGQQALAYYETAIKVGLPWYLRSRSLFWIAYVAVHLPIVALLPPRWVCALHALLLRRLDEQRRVAIYECSLAAALHAFVGGRIPDGIRMGFWQVAAGFSLRGARHAPYFYLACICMRAAFGLLGRDRRAHVWSELGAAARIASWSARHEWAYHMTSGLADVFLLDVRAVDHFDRAFAIAMRLRDPGLIEWSGRGLGETSRMFGDHERGGQLMRALTRMAEAENLDTVAVLAWSLRIPYLYGKGEHAAVLAANAELEARLGAVNRHDLLSALLRRLYVTAARVELASDREAAAREAVALLRDCERARVSFPIVSLPAVAFSLAIVACRRLDVVPGDLVAVLAQTRRRRRFFEVRSRWRRPLWLAAYAEYDACWGVKKRALPNCRAAHALMRRHGLIEYRAQLSRRGLVVYPPDSEMYRLCAAGLEEIQDGAASRAS